MITAFDVDLHKVYAINTDGVVLFNGFRGIPIWKASGITLVEVASPVSFGRGGTKEGTMYNLGKWAIHNIAIAAAMAEYTDILVSPSDAWTMKYTPGERHKLARADAKKYDLRECQAMIWSYTVNPKLWVPWFDYIESL